MYIAIFNNLFYSLLSFFVFFLSGLGLAMLITPKGLKKYTLFFSPLLGYCYIVLAGWHLATFGIQPEYNENGLITALTSISKFNFKGTDSYYWLILLSSVFLLALAMLKNRKNLKNSIWLTDRNLITPLVVGALCIIVLSVPMFRYGNGLSPISGTDIIDSALKSRFLKEFSLSDTVGYLSHIDPLQNYNFLKHDVMTNRFGTPYAAAFLSSVFHLEAYQMQMIVMTVLVFIGILVLYALAVEVFGYGQFAATAVSVLYSLSVIIYYLIYHGFQPQVAAMTLSIGFFLIQFYALNNSSRFSDYMVYIPIIALITWGLTSTYAHMIPFLYFIVSAYALALAVWNKSFKGLVFWIGLQVMALLVLTALSPFRMKALVGNLLLHANIEAGWDMPYILPDYVIGLNYKLKAKSGILGFNIFSLLMHVVLTIPVLFALYVGLSKAFKENKKIFLVSVICLSVIIGGQNLIYNFAVVSPKYKSFKFFSFFLPLTFLVLLIAFRKVSLKSKGFISGYVLISLIVANVLGDLIFFGLRTYKRYVPTSLAAVKKVETMPEVQSVNIMGDDPWEAMWMNVFLMKKKQYFKMTTYSGRNSNNVTDGQWDIFNMSSYGFPLEECKNDIIVLNFPYGLVRASRLDAEAMRAEIRISDLPEGISPEVKVPVNLRIKNISNHPWPLGCNPMRMLHLAYAWIDEEGKRVPMGSMLPLMRALNPGEEMPLNVEIIAPRKPGPYSLVFDILQENVAWFADKGSRPLALQVNVH